METRKPFDDEGEAAPAGEADPAAEDPAEGDAGTDPEVEPAEQP
jgi:hypothetical protein